MESDPQEGVVGAMSERSTVFRLRSGGSGASGTKLPQRSGQRQLDRQDQNDSGRNDRGGNVGRRFSFSRRDSGQGASTEGSGSVPSGVRSGFDEARTVGAVVGWWQKRGVQIIPAKRGQKFPSLEWRSYAYGKPLGFEATVALFGGADEPADSCNYAVLGGSTSDGLVVIDWDDRERALENPVDTLTVDTGKGRHYYVRVRSGTAVGNRSFPRARLDIRGSGGIAIAPPSLHPSGTCYALGNDKPILEVTEDWFNSYLAIALARYGEVDQRPDGKSGRPLGWFSETFSEVCPEGGRDNTAAALAGKLLNALHADDVRAIMYVWAEAKCDPPLERHDINRIVSSLERKRRFENEVSTAPLATEGTLADAPTSGAEDDWFSDLEPPALPLGDDTSGGE